MTLAVQDTANAILVFAPPTILPDLAFPLVMANATHRRLPGTPPRATTTAAENTFRSTRRSLPRDSAAPDPNPADPDPTSEDAPEAVATAAVAALAAAVPAAVVAVEVVAAASKLPPRRRGELQKTMTARSRSLTTCLTLVLRHR